MTTLDGLGISKELNCSVRNAERIMYIFSILGLVSIEKEEPIEEGGRPRNIYTLKEDVEELMNKTTGLFSRLKSPVLTQRSLWSRTDVQNPEKDDKIEGLGQKNDTTHTEKNNFNVDPIHIHKVFDFLNQNWSSESNGFTIEEISKGLGLGKMAVEKVLSPELLREIKKDYFIFQPCPGHFKFNK